MTLRVVAPDELAAWRRRLPKGWQRAVSRPVSKRRPSVHTELVGEDAAEFTTPVPQAQQPRQTYEQVVDLLMGQAKRSRGDFRQALAQMRKWSPSLLTEMSDEQAAVVLEQVTRAKVEEAVRRVFREQGREAELVIRIGEA